MADKALTKEELITFLTSPDGGYSADDVKDKGKAELKQLWEVAQSAKTVLDQAVVEKNNDVDIEVATATVEPEAIPSVTDPKWTEYVLKQFEPTELEDGNPKVDGLRRVAEKILGTFDIVPTVVQCPGLENGATVTVLLTFRDPVSGLMRRVGGSADVSSTNTAREYAVHSVATAETRAEGRALRKALRLTKVLAAEELHNAEPDEPTGFDDRAPIQMVQSLKIMCERAGVDFQGLAQAEFQKEISDISKQQGLKLSSILHEFKTGTREIPNDLKAI